MKDLCLENLPKLMELIGMENKSQLKKWGIQDHTSPEWMLILNKEVGELNKAVLESWFFVDSCLDLNADEKRAKLDQNVIDEAYSVATVALKIAEMFNAIK
jgi:hypothetical protein